MKVKGKKKMLMAVLGLCAALVAVPVPVAAGGAVSGQEGSYNVHCNGLSSGCEYTVTAVRGTLADYILSDRRILYTVQIHADSSETDVAVPLRKGENAVILLAGEITGARSPEVIGLIEDGMVSAHNYKVTCKEPTCTELG